MYGFPADTAGQEQPVGSGARRAGERCGQRLGPEKDLLIREPAILEKLRHLGNGLA